MVCLQVKIYVVYYIIQVLMTGMILGLEKIKILKRKILDRYH